ncbi:MAG: CpsD/CapB family tyrosine-protein kinase [Phycisphaerae bacterium]|nr:CpsD/CapB family tyrosine-protein kinase [Phycisphaerae bacterium]
MTEMDNFFDSPEEPLSSEPLDEGSYPAQPLDEESYPVDDLASQPVRRRISHAELSGRAEELYRGMWASLFYSGKVTGKVALVCSTARGEGASTTACGLALSGSGISGGSRVALVDFNLRSSSLHTLLGLRQSPGLAEAIINGQDMATVAQPVNEGLDVYTAGSVGHKSLNVLRSDAVETFFNTLIEQYDYVLVDVAPANHYPDAQVLAGILKEVVLVVQSDQTPREAIAQAKKRIESGGGKVVGLVLNKRTFPIPNFLYRRV